MSGGPGAGAGGHLPPLGPGAGGPGVPGPGRRARAFLAHDAGQLHDPMTLKGMPEAVSRIETALAHQESICVYGDYDVDGITATCLLTDYLRRRGAW